MSDEPDGKRAETIDAVSRELTDIEIWINEGRYDSVFTSLYPGRDINTCKTRYSGLIKIYRESYLNDIDKNTINANESEAGKVVIVSAPGRTEVCGNHTDHQHGNVLAAAIDLDIICVAAPNERNAIRLQSIGHAGSIYVDLCDLSPNDGERGDAAALVRGLPHGSARMASKSADSTRTRRPTSWSVRGYRLPRHSRWLSGRR